jgi:hypothetical protein
LKTPHPDKAVGVANIPKLTNDPHADGFLGLHELPVKQFDKSVSGSGIKGVLPQIHDRTARLAVMHR